MINIAKPLLVEVADFVRFSAVCKSWKAIADKVGKKRVFTPWLMLPQPGTGDYRDCFSLSRGEIFHLYLPECRDKRCFGSPFGWLLTVGLDHSVQLLNPFTRRQISLPSLPPFQYAYGHPKKPTDVFRMLVSQFALSSSTLCSRNSCVVMVMYYDHRRVALASSGDEAWTEVEIVGDAYDDAIFFKGRLFVISCMGKLSICEINTPHPRPVDFMPQPERDVQSKLGEKYNLVEMGGDLHLVVRMFDDDHDAPVGIIHFVAKLFKVFKLDFDSKKWIELVDLGDHALFVGTNTSFSISTSNYTNLKRNSIYFTDDDDEGYTIGDGGGQDMGIFDFEKKTIEQFYMGYDVISSFCPPLFFMPSLE